VFHGRAWPFRSLPHLQNCATMNVLYFLASVFGPWIDLLEGNLLELSCNWSQTDSATVDGWMNQSSLHDVCSAHFEGSRKLAQRSYPGEIPTRPSEWIPGDTSKVADSLYRETDLATLLHLHIPLQPPPNFEIKALPAEISSWLTSLLQKLPALKQSPNRPI
jgi:hypothetical protein